MRILLIGISLTIISAPQLLAQERLEILLRGAPSAVCGAPSRPDCHLLMEHTGSESLTASALLPDVSSMATTLSQNVTARTEGYVLEHISREPQPIGTDELRSKLREIAEESFLRSQQAVDGQRSWIAISTGTRSALCGILNGGVEICFIFEGGRPFITCATEVDYGPFTGDDEIVHCARESAYGSGIQAFTYAIFLFNDGLRFVTFIPDDEYVSGWGLPDGRTLFYSSTFEYSEFFEDLKLRHCLEVTLSADQIVSETPDCEEYIIDPNNAGIRLESGRSSMGDLLMNVYDDAAQRLISRVSGDQDSR